MLCFQITPKAHLQRQHSEEKYAFIHSRDQSFDGYLANNLVSAVHSVIMYGDLAWLPYLCEPNNCFKILDTESFT